MDEPFVGVDAATEAPSSRCSVNSRRGKTLLVVHHDLSNALNILTC